MFVNIFIEKLLEYRELKALNMSNTEQNWLSKVFQYYENLDKNEILFLRYLNVKIDQIPQTIVDYLNYSNYDDLYTDLLKNIPPFQNSIQLDDILIEDKFTSEKISAFANNFNIQKGMYKIHNRLNNYVIKAEVNGSEGLYRNKWIYEGNEIEYILEQTKVNSGKIKNSEINTSIIKSINDKTINNFYLFVRDASKNERLYTFKGSYKVISFNDNLKSIRLRKKDTKDIQNDLKDSVEVIIQDSKNNPFYEKFKVVEHKQRLGQKLFRELLISKYPSRKCAICEIHSPEHLIANHIKPFRDCNLNEAIDPNNGLLLCPDHNHLMDRGYLSFNADGKIILSKKLNKDLISEFRLKDLLEKQYSFNDDTHGYIKYHKEKVFLND
jgi:predicted restriction endonuclease